MRVAFVALWLVLAALPARAQVVCGGATSTSGCGGSGSGGGGGTGASTALDNLGSVSINANLIPQAAKDLGAQATPWRDLWLYGSGTFGSHSFRITGTPTGHRVMTIPGGASDTFGLLGTGQTWSGVNRYSVVGGLTLSAGAGSVIAENQSPILFATGGGGGRLVYQTNDTPDTLKIGVGVASNALVIAKDLDTSFPHEHALRLYPMVYIHSQSQSTTKWIGIGHNDSDGVIEAGSGAVSIPGSGASSVQIGASAQAVGTNATAVGALAVAGSGADATAIGASADCSHQGSVCLGYNADSTAANQFIAGGSTGVTAGYFGKGVTSSSPSAFTAQATSGSGTDIAGAAYNIAGGRGTGAGAGGNVGTQTSPALTTGTTLQTLETRGLVVAKQFTLTDNTVATFAVMTLGNDTGGGGTIDYCVKARDATNEQMECGAIYYAGVDETAGAGGENCPNPTKVGTPLQSAPTGTLTVTFAATTGTDLCNLRVTADTSLTPTTLWMKWSIAHNSGQVVTPQ